MPNIGTGRHVHIPSFKKGKCYYCNLKYKDKHIRFILPLIVKNENNHSEHALMQNIQPVQEQVSFLQHCSSESNPEGYEILATEILDYHTSERK